MEILSQVSFRRSDTAAPVSSRKEEETEVTGRAEVTGEDAEELHLMITGIL